MFIHIRKSQLSIPAEEAVKRTRDQIVPMLRKQPGFRGYFGSIIRDGKEAITVTLYDDASTAGRANDAVRETVGSQRWISGDSEVLHGRVVLGANMEAVPPDDAFFVIRAFDGVKGEDVDRATLVRDILMPLITQAPGFIAHYGFTNDRITGQAVALSIFDTEEHAMRSHDQVSAMIDQDSKLKQVMPKRPQVTAGRVIVLAKP
jgi:heme-degrading monooxygenase HmoA